MADIPLADGYVKSNGEVISASGENIVLDAVDQRLMAALAAARGNVVPNCSLLEAALEGNQSADDKAYLRQRVTGLRRKLVGAAGQARRPASGQGDPGGEADNAQNRQLNLIANVRGEGYRLAVPVQADRVPQDSLVLLESLDGNLYPGSAVWVHTAQPIETLGNSVPLTRQVISNMQQRVSYRYFLDRQPENVVPLITALWIAGRTAGCSPEKLLGLWNSSLKIHLFDRYLPFDFCIHNAANNHRCVCHVRAGDGQSDMLEWGKGAEAYRIVSALNRLRPVTENERDCILQGTRGHSLQSQPELIADLKSMLYEHLGSVDLVSAEIETILKKLVG